MSRIRSTEAQILAALGQLEAGIGRGGRNCGINMHLICAGKIQ